MMDEKKPIAVNKALAEVLLNVVTRHDRTSCSDDNQCNGYRPMHYVTPRCTRCLLLHVATDSLPDGVTVFVDTISLKWSPPGGTEG